MDITLKKCLLQSYISDSIHDIEHITGFALVISVYSNLEKRDDILFYTTTPGDRALDSNRY